MKLMYAAALVMLIGTSSNALGALITLEYTARIDSSSLSSIPVGTILTGQYTFDDAQPDQNPSPVLGSYDFIFGSIALAGTNYTMSPASTISPFFIHDPFTSIILGSEYGGFVEESYVVRSLLSGPALDGLIPSTVFFQLFSYPGEGTNALDTDEIVVSSIPVANFANNSFSLTFGSGSNTGQAIGDILSIDPVSVTIPVSDSAALLGLGLLSALIMRRRGAKKVRLVSGAA